MVLEAGQLTIQTLTNEQWSSMTEEQWDEMLLCVPSINDPSSSFKGRAFGRTHSRVFGSRFDIASDELDPFPPADGVVGFTGPLDEDEFSNTVAGGSIRHPGGGIDNDIIFGILQEHDGDTLHNIGYVLLSLHKRFSIVVQVCTCVC